jgi:transcriptional regulator with XRE-family HTH domain
LIPIGNRIKELRQLQKLAQDRLALRADYDQSSLSKLERGVQAGISRPAAERIAKALGIPLEELVRGTDHEQLLHEN